jgi:hypothetical protein
MAKNKDVILNFCVELGEGAQGNDVSITAQQSGDYEEQERLVGAKFQKSQDCSYTKSLYEYSKVVTSKSRRDL